MVQVFKFSNMNDLEVNSTVLSDRIREEKSVFILPGDCYGMDHYFRIGIGAEKNYLKRGLDLVDEVLAGDLSL